MFWWFLYILGAALWYTVNILYILQHTKGKEKHFNIQVVFYCIQIFLMGLIPIVNYIFAFSLQYFISKNK